MTAASGVMHEEFHSRIHRTGGIFEMIQLWINLPAKGQDGRTALPGAREGNHSRRRVA